MNPGGPSVSVYWYLFEKGDSECDGFVSISEARLRVKAFDGDYGEIADNLDEAMLRMSLASVMSKKEYHDLCDKVRLMPSARKQAVLLNEMMKREND